MSSILLYPFSDHLYACREGELLFAFPRSDQGALKQFLLDHADQSFYYIYNPRYTQVVGILYDLHETGDIEPPYIVGPLWRRSCFPGSAFRKYLWRRVIKQRLPATQGGPRPITTDDLISSVLADSNEFQIVDPTYLAISHSFWLPAHLFLIAKDEALAYLLGMIWDPRWYLRETDGSTKRYDNLFRSFGFSWDTFKLAIKHPENSRFDPWTYAVACWYDSPCIAEGLVNLKNEVTDPLAIGNRPGDIFIRSFFAESLMFGVQRAVYNTTLLFCKCFCDFSFSLLLSKARSDKPCFFVPELSAEENENFNQMVALLEL